VCLCSTSAERKASCTSSLRPLFSWPLSASCASARLGLYLCRTYLETLKIRYFTLLYSAFLCFPLLSSALLRCALLDLRSGFAERFPLLSASYSALLCFTLLYSALLALLLCRTISSALRCFTLLYSALLCFTLL
jgi:hypothetical protein